MIVVNKYGNTIQKKNVMPSGLNVVLWVRTMKPITTGTELTDASVTSSALSGRAGITTAKSSVHTATQESPIQPLMFSRVGSRVLSDGDAVAADDFEGEPKVHHDRQRHARARGDGPHEDGHGNGNGPRYPVRRDIEQLRATMGKKERREESRHEERERVEQGERAQPSG